MKRLRRMDACRRGKNDPACRKAGSFGVIRYGARDYEFIPAGQLPVRDGVPVTKKMARFYCAYRPISGRWRAERMTRIKNR